jgi:hypothetical protein
MDITHRIREALEKEGKLVKRVASEASRPKSLFGKHQYLTEQFMIRAFGNKVAYGTLALNPEGSLLIGGVPRELEGKVTTIPEEIFKIYPKKARYAFIRGNLRDAKNILKDIGV